MTFKEKLKTWQSGLTGFNAWLQDIEPRILGRNNRYQPFTHTPKQKKFIKQVLATDRAGRFKHSISLNIEPRRHGKSTVFALIVLWFFTSRQNFTIQLLGSSEDHCRRVQFNTLKKIINASPKLAQLIPEQNQFAYTIQFPELRNVTQYSASNTATAFGDRINLMWCSDLHAFVDLAPFNALQASLLDSEDSLLFIDSNVDDTDGHVHGLQKEAVSDPDMLCQFTSYRDFEHYAKAAPAWIDRKKAARLQKTTFEPDFKRDILGQRSDAKNALFTSEIIQLCKSRYHAPVDDSATLTQGRAYKIGAGLDRAKSLIAGPRGDFTVWTVILKVATQGGEPKFYILNQHRFLINSTKAIKAVILEDHKRYGLDNVILENYEVSDLHSWMLENNINCELISAHDTNQNASFPEFYRIAKEGRFHFPAELATLESELSTFTYTHRKNNTYSFGHSSTKFHDDTVYSTNWAIFSLRREVLNLFEIADINCFNRSRNRHHCFLMGGNLELHCKKDCPAYDQVAIMWRQYRSFQVESEITLPDFFHSFVKVSGAVFYQSA
ncbi:hypothetical protein DSCW_12780 [Desulfosarcina widdelii]|uniref:Terminase n=1 Tax=Desulfosarcina widdelii TaxID=947919 RepID=A0A5K7Z2X0_9BACT|nr:hypothetical protein [Desulfosarcina widdelii]BBO73861.1 hypothetical protein DSCW_12780 [Desulfosarcina widdelii]